LSACASSEAPSALATKYKCAPLASDIIIESRREPSVDGDSWDEIAGNLKLDAKRKGRALRRAVGAYEACRKT
jgi:hypothetical protein